MVSFVEVNSNNFKLLELLDVLKDFKKIPDKDEKAVIEFLLNRFKRLSVSDLELLVKCSLKYTPSCRAFLGALLDSIGYSKSLNELRDNINPLTSYKLGIRNDILTTAPNWNIK